MSPIAPPVVPSSAPRRAPHSTPASSRLPELCLVLAITGAAILLVLWLRERYANDADGMVALAAIGGLLSDQEDGLPPGLVPIWTGHAADENSSKEARAVRIGARQAALEIVSRQRFAHGVQAYFGRDSAALAIVAHGSERAAGIAAALAQELDHLDGGAASARMYREVERLARAQDYFGQRAREARDALPRVRPQHVAVGYWLEYARVAALRRDTAFFRSPESRAIAAAAVDLPRLGRADHVALEAVRDGMAGGSLPDVSSLEPLLTRALVELSR